MMLWLAAFNAASAFGLKLNTRPLPYPAPDATFSSQGKIYHLKAYRGRKVMLWMFSTWCHTCAAGVRVLSAQRALLARQGLVVLAIRNHNNHGYPGLGIEAFVKQFGGPALLDSPHWVLGEASQAMDRVYNARKYPDVYFLIDEKGRVQAVSTAPHLSIKTIIKFASGGKENK